MPFFTDVKFINNTNNHDLGSGSIAIYDALSYIDYSVTLTVTNCVFEANHGINNGAIGLQGVSLTVKDSIFTKNTMKYGSSISFNAYKRTADSRDSVLTINNCTFSENDSDYGVMDVYIYWQSTDPPL